MIYGNSPAPSHTLVASLASKSVSRRATSFAETSAASQTRELRLRLHSWGGGGLHLPRLRHFQQPLPRHWTEQMAKEQQHYQVSERWSGITTCWPSAPRWRCTGPACLARCSTVARSKLYSRQARRLNTFHLCLLRRIPKDILYGELATGTRPIGRPILCFKDVCKRDQRQAI